MKRDNKVQRLVLSDEFLLDSADKRLQEGDYLGALTMLNKRAKMYEPSADASALYADVYEAMEQYHLAADAWFRFLDTCNEADFSEGYEGLAVAFMNMGNDVQSAIYYQKILAEDEEISDEGREAILTMFPREESPKLRLVHAEGKPDDDTDVLHRGLFLFRAGELEEAKKALSAVGKDNPEYPSAAGLSAMCTLMMGEDDEAERECRELLERHPDNVQALTTYCAVLGARENRAEARKVAERLAELKTDSTDDLYRIATALCETELDEKAYETLTVLKERLPYDNNVLYFHAAAAYRTGRTDEAVQSLERLCTVYPRAAVAEYYLVRMRELKDGGAPFSMNYYYRVPEEEYRTVANFLLTAHAAGGSELEELSALPELEEFFRIAFDEMDGRDAKLQMLAAKVAVKCRCDGFVRDMLLDYEADELVKLAVLHDLTMRNEDNSFGTVLLSVYREFFTHKIEIGARKRTAFMKAFADVYSKFAVMNEENEEKIVNAAEDVYHTLAQAEAWDCMDERAALASVIYREARLPKGERSVEDAAKLFDANVNTVKEILNFVI